jgi:alkylresorcinol/alkylpyrone synthase
MIIASVAGAHPPHYYSQSELIAAFQAFWAQEHHNVGRVARFHEAVLVGGRHLALPMERYPLLTGFGESNTAFIEVGTDVAERALRQALDEAGLLPTDLDAIFFTTVTGIAAPSIDARLVNRVGLRPDIKRTPMFGLGCVAGAAGVARMHDYLKAYPTHRAALVSVELCSLTLQRRDLSIPNLVASGLFGDGAAVVIGLGDEVAGDCAGPRVVASQSRFYPNTEHVMGWDIADSGFRIVLDAGVPRVAREFLGGDFTTFAEAQGFSRDDVRAWVCHPGGPKVLEAFEEALGITRDDLALTWRTLREVGNLSSASVLLVLRDTLAERRPKAGELGVMIAMGPGFCSEFVLLQFR